MSEAAGQAERDQPLLAWTPTTSTWFWWMGVGTMQLVAATLVYEFVAYHGQIPMSLTINITLAVVLYLALLAAHEGIHGLATMAFGGRPEYGVLRAGRIPMGFYATAPGHRFERWPYILIALAPTLIIAPLGVLLCWSPLGEFLWIPLGAHFGGCVGDLAITRHVLAAPSGAFVEDLRDGLRIWSGSAVR